MGAFMGFFFGEEDVVLVEEIAKVHGIDKEVVEKHYKEMLQGIKNDVQK